MIDRLLVRDTFSKMAESYEINSYLQKEIADLFLNKILIESNTAQKVLDIGMGTGYLTKKLKEHLIESQIFGIDFADGMTHLATRKGLQAIQAEAEEICFKDLSFDLIISNLLYHWVEDLDSAFGEVYRCLRKRGKFYFTCFGSQTLKELRSSFDFAIKIREVFADYKFPTVNLLQGALLKNNFKDIQSTTKLYKEYFGDLFSLVDWLKNTGVNRITKPIFIGKKVWQKANRIYLNSFKDNGSIYATFELIKIVAKK